VSVQRVVLNKDTRTTRKEHRACDCQERGKRRGPLLSQGPSEGAHMSTSLNVVSRANVF